MKLKVSLVLSGVTVLAWAYFCYVEPRNFWDIAMLIACTMNFTVAWMDTFR